MGMYDCEGRTLDNPGAHQGQADPVIYVETAEREPDRLSPLPPRPPVAGAGGRLRPVLRSLTLLSRALQRPSHEPA